MRRISPWEGASRSSRRSAELAEQQGSPLTARQRDALKQRMHLSATEQLRGAPKHLTSVQLVCASATVAARCDGSCRACLTHRASRKPRCLWPHRNATQAADKRRGALMPATLSHRYLL